MRNIPEERLKRRQSDKRKETIHRSCLWVIVVLGLTGGIVELTRCLI